jgi:hypothetical protein
VTVGHDIARNDCNRWILLKNSNLPALATQIEPMWQRHMVQRPAGSTAIEIAPAILRVALRAIDTTRETFALQLDLGRPRA